MGMTAVGTRIGTRDQKASRGWLLRVLTAAILAIMLAPLSACGGATPSRDVGSEAPPQEIPQPPPPPPVDDQPQPPEVILPERPLETPAPDNGAFHGSRGREPAPPPLDTPNIQFPEESAYEGDLSIELRDVIIGDQIGGLLLGVNAGDEPDGPLPARGLGVVLGPTLPGRFAYGAPSVMIVGEPYFLSVTIAAPTSGETTPQLDLRLAQDTRESLGADSPASIRPGDVMLSSNMSAELTGDGFEITELTEARQSVDLRGGVTRWLWEVRGTAAGRSSLVMRLTIAGEGGAPDKLVRVVPSVIDVRSEADAFLSREQMAAKTPPPGEAVDQDGTRDARSSRLASIAAPASPAAVSPLPAGRCTTTGVESRKVALVIGNDAYTGITRLTYARADSVIMRDVLVESGFRVMHCEDLDASQLPAALESFRGLVKSASTKGEAIAAFYYSGHGASTPSQNETYLLPVSLRQATVGQIEAQGVSVGQVIGGLSNAGARRLIVVIDACRDVLRMEDGEYRGFRVLNWRTSAFDIVAYATMWGEKARDNGLYAKSLAASIRALPNADVADIFNRVQTEISNATGEDQVPQYNDRMPGVFAFRN